LYRNNHLLFRLAPVARESANGVESLVTGATIGQDSNKLREFADNARLAYETLHSMGALSEMNMNNLSRVSAKLPIRLQVKWRDTAQNLRENGRQPDYREFVKFIERCASAANDPVFGRIGEASFAPKSGMSGGSSSRPKRNQDKLTTLSTQVADVSKARYNGQGSTFTECSPCRECSGAHRLDQCERFKGKAVRQRQAIIREHKLCINCLRQGHFRDDCQSKWKCSKCGSKHHTLLHREATSDSARSSSAATQNGPPRAGMNQSKSARPNSSLAAPQASSVHTVSAFEMKTSGLVKLALQVVPVTVYGENGQSVTTLALLDSGSEESFIRGSLAEEIGLRPRTQESLLIATMSGETTVEAGRVTFAVEAAKNPIQRVAVEGIKVEHLNVGATRPADLRKWPHLQGLTVTEVESNEVGILIGVNVPECQVHYEARIGREGEPFAVRTVLGWSIFGPIGEKKIARSVSVNHLRQENLEEQMSQFLGLENVDHVEGVGKGRSVEDKRAEKMLQQSTRFVDGRYQVGMLWREENVWLPCNRAVAEKRLQSLERKLRKDTEQHKQYSDFMKNQFDRGFARRMTEQEASKFSSRSWYLPHHAVFHPQKKKIRVVFDAAATFNAVSLNSQLLSGPDLNNSLLGVLLRFRERQIAIVGDVQKMFMQVAVSPEDTDALRFLWWENGDMDGPVMECQMLRHVFGAKDSPSCCIYALKRAAQDNQGFSAEARQTVEKDFYCDDLLKSVDSVNEGRDLVQEVTAILSTASFKITGWLSNSREVLATIPNQERAATNLDLDLDSLPISRALGVEWDTEKDIFQFTCHAYSSEFDEKSITKREVLSTLSSLFDPLGFVCPVALVGKNLMQQLWRLKLGWDEPLPAEERYQWQQWRQELVKLQQVKIPRCYLTSTLGLDVEEISLHTFSDASTVGYGICSYLRFQYPSGEVHCSFLMGRSRCAPLKVTTIPRLELQAATLAAKMYSTVTEELTLSIDKAVFWTDSMTVLQYIRNEEKRFEVYVANRIATIRELTKPDQWRHCPGVKNPADDASRGLKPGELANQERWWNGPEFLWEPAENWPQTPLSPAEEEESDSEVLNVHVIAAQGNKPGGDNGLLKAILKRSSWPALKRVVAYVIRFCKGLLSGNRFRTEEEFQEEELDQAELLIIRTVQEECLPTEMSKVQEGRPCSHTSMLSSLKPMLIGGVLRVGGRLKNAPMLSEDERHPLIVPKKHHVAELIARDIHERNAHAPREQVLAESRKKFWLIGGRRLCKQIIRHCFGCRRRNAQRMQQIMADLPISRLIPFKPVFTYTGIDLFGPLQVKWGRGTVKRWGVLFTCMTTRAVFLEVAPSLSTDDFILVLRQFVCRRGPPEEITTDNGSNFVGAERELREAIEGWNQQKIAAALQQKGVRWKFQVPTAAHMSGVWERLVSGTKRHLKALAGSCLLTDYGLRTLLAEVEAILNSRPICPVSEDPGDLEALTPNHFLLSRKCSGLPPGIFVKEDKLLRKEWRKVQYLLDLFWHRWIREYLPELQERKKWQHEEKNVKEGDLVLLAEDGVKRGQWPLGRVERAFPGSDGHVRSALVKTASGKFHRPIVKLCLVEEGANLA